MAHGLPLTLSSFFNLDSQRKDLKVLGNANVFRVEDDRTAVRAAKSNEEVPIAVCLEHCVYRKPR
jgi:hypothetical protein